MDEYKQVRLVVSPEVRAVLDSRRLNDEELQKTIFHAEKTGKKFIHSQTGRFLAGLGQDSVFVWVEYVPKDDGYQIYTAYQHRVRISAWDLKRGRRLSD